MYESYKALKIERRGRILTVTLNKVDDRDMQSIAKSLGESRHPARPPHLEKPIIARVNGHAMGLGTTLAAWCDVSFMTRQARLGDTHVKMGLAAGDGGALLWPLLIGVSRAKELLLSGEVMTAERAAEIGLIGHAVDGPAWRQGKMSPQRSAFFHPKRRAI